MGIELKSTFWFPSLFSSFPFQYLCLPSIRQVVSSVLLNPFLGSPSLHEDPERDGQVVGSRIDGSSSSEGWIEVSRAGRLLAQTGAVADGVGSVDALVVLDDGVLEGRPELLAGGLGLPLGHALSRGGDAGHGHAGSSVGGRHC